MISLANALAHGPLLLDGGIGTLLEAQGHDISSELWSASMLLNNPDAIRQAHADYFAAGAQVAITSSYQVSYERLATLGLDESAVDELLALSVELAIEARRNAEALVSRPRWIAASVGPYGAMLADGSEYRGDYGLSVNELRAWHRRRIVMLAQSDADLLAAETIPSLAEVEAIASEIDDADAQAWISVTSAFGKLRSGESLAEAYEIAASVTGVVAVGVNCTDPLDVTAAIQAARGVTDKPVIVYPNSGEQWDAKNRRWMGDAAIPNYLVREWLDAGASMVGGCCRVGPVEIAEMAGVIHRARVTNTFN